MTRSTTIRLGAILLVLLIGPAAALQGAEDKPVPEDWKKGYDTITANDSYSYLEFIASDELEGRDTATRGLAIARNYIKSLYKTWGVQPAGDGEGDERSYDRRIDMVEIAISEETSLEVVSGTNSTNYNWQTDFTGGIGVDVTGLVEGSAVFAGYGISAPDLGYDDYAGIDVRGKVVVTFIGKPGGDREDSPFNVPENRARFAGRRTPAENGANLLAQKGARAFLIIDESLGQAVNPGGYRQGARIGSARRSVTAPKLSAAIPRVPTFWISSRVAKSLFAASGKSFEEIKKQIDGDLKPHSMDLPETRVEIELDVKRTPTVSANVLGMIEGRDPKLKNEYIVIGAHLDHIGMNADGYVFNGADDNGSGSVGVLQLAKAFAMNPVRPKRTIIFAHWTGEEKGLLGSRYFVEYPPVPFSNVVACLNLDMICKDTSLEAIKSDVGEFDITEEELSNYPDEPENLVTAYTSSPSPIITEYSVNLGRDYLGLHVVPLSSFPMIGNSDHYPFALEKVPSVFFNTQGHRDLHQPGDTVEKINAEKMSKIVKLTYLMAFTIAEEDERPAWKPST